MADQIKLISRMDLLNVPDYPMPVYPRGAGHYIISPGVIHYGGERQDFVQLFWGVSGSGLLKIADRSCLLAPGALAIKFSGEFHSYHAQDSLWELRWLTFDGSNADSFMRSFGYPLFNERAGDCPFHLFEEYAKGLSDSRPNAQRALFSVLAQVLALAGGIPVENESSSGRLLRKALALINTNYREHMFNVSALSEMLGVHRSTVNRAFKEAMEGNPCDYIMQLRIRHAMNLLKDSNMKISDIAVDSGFPDKTYFCRVMKNAFGKSPKELRD